MADELLDGALAHRLLGAAEAEGLDLAGALRGSDEQLRPTEVAQPALLFVELVLADTLPRGLEVVGVAGHSVGEYAAVTVAGGLTPEEALRLVIRRGREMAAMTEGTMAAVLGLDAEVVVTTCAEVSTTGDAVVVANLNAPGQVVISGTVPGVDRAATLLRQRGARRVVPLNVSGAFHSPLMAPAARRFAEAIAAAPLGALRFPIVCNVDAVAVSDAAELPSRLAAQLEFPVRWVDCVHRLVDLGAEVLVEVGPGAVLSGLARRIVPQVRAVAVNDPSSAVAVTTSWSAPA